MVGDKLIGPLDGLIRDHDAPVYWTVVNVDGDRIQVVPITADNGLLGDGDFTVADDDRRPAVVRASARRWVQATNAWVYAGTLPATTVDYIVDACARAPIGGDPVSSVYDRANRWDVHYLRVQDTVSAVSTLIAGGAATARFSADGYVGDWPVCGLVLDLDVPDDVRSCRVYTDAAYAPDDLDGHVGRTRFCPTGSWDGDDFVVAVLRDDGVSYIVIVDDI